jgi:hypothetical protein
VRAARLHAVVDLRVGEAPVPETATGLRVIIEPQR